MARQLATRWQILAIQQRFMDMPFAVLTAGEPGPEPPWWSDDFNSLCEIVANVGWVGSIVQSDLPDQST